MATSRQNSGLGDFRALFQVGSFVGMSDAELLERYVTGCGGIAEVAFAALVERHGQTVLRVCNDVLNDPHDAQDAAQVTFLVLAKRAARSASAMRWRVGCSGSPGGSRPGPRSRRPDVGRTRGGGPRWRRESMTGVPGPP